MTPDAEAIEVATPAGPVVRGQRWGEGSNVAVLIHAPDEDVDAWADFPLFLAGDSLMVVAVDLPGHGLSDDPWEPAHLVDSIRSVVDHVCDDGAKRVFMLAAGASISGALRAAVASDATALVALSPPDAEDDQTAADLRVSKLPKLLLVGAGQERALAAARRVFQRSAGWTVLSTLPTREQGTGLIVGPWGRQAREQILAFLRDYRSYGNRPPLGRPDAGGP